MAVLDGIELSGRNDFAFDKTVPRYVMLFRVEYLCWMAYWVFLVVLDCWIERTEIDVTATLVFFEAV